jgi:hypothetical protein
MDRGVVGRAVLLVGRAVAVPVGRDLAVGGRVARVGEQGVGAGPAVDRVEAPVARVDRVVALLALDAVLGGATGDRVVPTPAAQAVAERVADDGVVARAAESALDIAPMVSPSPAWPETG